MKTLFKILSLVFSIMFIYGAVVQYNDPDALIWYLIYGVAALASILFFMGKLNYNLAALLCVLYLIGTFWNWPEQFEGVTIGEGDIVNIEKGREALGTLIISVVMLVYAMRIRFGSKS
ncbi:transmembrane 220 family protein [Muriicola sp. Z0-33]|uniref:transmembrane 220 family protein n=1 Tax=Muriicola sp. Z0-33 TaxID=2816957 RepID=UPI00223744F6|nr:transmembrane 220 family protein [Muriicola sp. Z0-33]MCW5517449.1 transmembrane 220 family protein [Muriicola sp. Z0-33]